MSTRPFAIAFSFPGEHRQYVEKVAHALLPAFGKEGEGKARLFYDAWHEVKIIGYGSARKLQAIYANDCDLIVPFYCKDYLNKRWCGVELRAIEELLFDQQYDRVLPFRFDMVDIPGSFRTDVFPVVTDRPPVEVAALILERYNDLQKADLSLPPPPAPPTPPRTGNLRRANSGFVGRQAELKQLSDAVFSGRPGGVTAVYGLGGMGKTELVMAFAERHAARFPAGLWILGAEKKTELLPLLGELVGDLGLPASAGPDETGDQRGRRVVGELERRTKAARAHNPTAACLVLLDNVSVPALLSGPQLDTLPREDWLRIVVTTRLGQDRLTANRRSLNFVPVDALDETAALELLAQYQPDGHWPAASAPADEAAARELVRELGGFTLAVEAIALYLGQHPDLRPTAYLARLRKEGLPSADALGHDPAVADQLRHREKQLGLVLDTTLENLTPQEQTTLEFSAFLPPDSIPWPWLKSVVTHTHPEALRCAEGYPDPWLGIRTKLEGQRLLTPGDHPKIVRLHRLVGAHLRNRLSAEATKAWRSVLEDFLNEFTGSFEEKAQHSVDVLWLLRPLQETILLLAATRLDLRMGENAGVVGTIEMQMGRMDRALVFINLYQRACEEHLAKDPASERANRDLANSQSQLGAFLAWRGLPGDADKALALFQRCSETLERLFAANPDSVQAARDVSISLDRLGDFLSSRGSPGDADKAIALFQRSLEVREQLLAANSESAQAARDVSVSLSKLGAFLARRGLPGDADKTLNCYERDLEISERLLAANPDSALAARDVAVSLERSGDFLAGRGLPGDVDKALNYYERDLAISERLLVANPESAQATRDVAVSLNKLGAFLTSRGLPGDADKALALFQRSLELSERRLAANPDSAQAARDVLVPLERLADMAADPTTALHHQGRSLTLARQLWERTGSLEMGRTLVISLIRTAQLYTRNNQEEAHTKHLADAFALLDSFAREGRPLDAQMRSLHEELKRTFSSKQPEPKTTPRPTDAAPGRSDDDPGN